MVLLKGFIFFLFSSLIAFGSIAFSENLHGRWIDLTHDFAEDTIYWPTAETFKLDTVFEGISDKGFYYTAYQYCAAEHGGTHVDAPVHFAKGGKTIDQIAVEDLIGNAIVINVSNKTLINRDYQVGVKDITEWEAQYGKIKENTIILLNTGYGKYWPNRIKYMGTDKRGAEAVAGLHFPGLHPNAAKWLVENRKIKAIGLDTPSIDYGQSIYFKSHQILFKENIPAFENVANIDQLPAIGATVIALPMKIRGGSGAPLRIVALIE